MFCQKCGEEIKNNNKFCQNCNTHIAKNFITKNTITMATIIILILTITTIILSFCIMQKTTKDAIYNKENYLEKSAISYPLFVGSRVLVKVEINKPFLEPNKDIMTAIQYRLEENLIDNGYYEPIIQQVAKDKFIVYIQDEFDEKIIEKILTLKPILEFKKHTAGKNYEPQNFENINLSINDLKNVAYEKNDHGTYLISLEFSHAGAKQFAKITKELIGEQLGIFINNKLISAPTIQEEVVGGKAQITGVFSYDEIKEIVNVLNASIVPTSIKILDIK